MKKSTTITAAHANQETDAGEASDDVVTVSDVFGAGEDAHRIVRVGACTFKAPPLAKARVRLKVRDVDLAQRLVYKRPEKIRDLIRRLISEGKLNDVEVFTPAGKTSGGRPAREYWLTEAQALKVVAKSETAKADALLDEVIRVFMLAVDGLLPQAIDPKLIAEHTAPLHEALSRKDALLVARDRDLDIVRAENRTLREQQTNGTITAMAADWIREQITVVAPMMAMLGWCPRKQTVRAARRVLQNGIAQAAGWGHERGQEIADMPTTGYPHARAYLKAKRESAEAEIAKRARDTKAAADAIMLARQGTLFAEPGANQNAGRAVS